MKKHGLLPQKAPEEVRPKWSSKKKTEDNRIRLDDSDEWDSDTEDALINHFFPQLGQDVSKEHKQKIRQQILEALEEGKDIGQGETLDQIQDEKRGDQNRDEKRGDQNRDEKRDGLDGIYLGTKPEPSEGSVEKTPVSVSLHEILANAPKRLRKLLENKVSDNFLEEYGLDSYSELAKVGDYDAVRKPRSLDEIPAEELDGFVVGEEIDRPRATMVELSEQDVLEDDERRQKAERQRVHEQMRRKFAPKQTSSLKVIDLNNVKDREYVNLRIGEDAVLVGEDDFNRDLSELLGEEESWEPEQEQEDVLSKLDKLGISNSRKGKEKGKSTNGMNEKEKSSKGMKSAPKSDFLDELLG